MAVNKLISLDIPTAQLVEKLFKDINFSEWVRCKVMEEHDKEGSIEALNKNINELNIKIDHLTNRREELKSILEEKIKDAKTKQKIKEEQEEKENNTQDKQVERLIQKIGLIFVQLNIKIDSYNARYVAEQIAKLYLQTTETERTDLKDYVINYFAEVKE